MVFNHGVSNADRHGLIAQAVKDSGSATVKLGRTAHAYVGPSTLMHTRFTDTTAPAEEVAALEGTGTVVKTA
jgi:hypothetical protein